MTSFSLKSGAILLAVAVLAHVHPSEGQTCEPTQENKLELKLATGAMVNSCSNSDEVTLSAIDWEDQPLTAQYKNAKKDTKYALIITMAVPGTSLSSLIWLLSDISGSELRTGAVLADAAKVYSYTKPENTGHNPEVIRVSIYVIKPDAGEVNEPDDLENFDLSVYQAGAPFNTDEPFATQLVKFKPEENED